LAASPEPVIDGAEDAGAIELLSSVESALQGLQPECRRIFALLLSGASRHEVLAAFGDVPIGTIDSRISRCRDKLLAALESPGRSDSQ
jgi:DNA-directed RNA polymerase specialized sigma24 family protein